MDNFKSYHASLVARLEMARQKMSAQTVGNLVDIGRRLTSVDFVVFLLGYHDVQSLKLAPLAAASESLSHEAVVVARRVQTTIESLTCDRDSVWRIQGWATVTVLLLGFCAPRDLASLWCALRYTRHGRAFPTLCRHLPLILLRVAFMGCQLTWQVDPREIDASKVKLVAPHCQCSSRRFAAPRERAPVYMQRASRIVSMPQWVAFSRHDFRMRDRLRLEGPRSSTCVSITMMWGRAPLGRCRGCLCSGAAAFCRCASARCTRPRVGPTKHDLCLRHDPCARGPLRRARAFAAATVTMTLAPPGFCVASDRVLRISGSPSILCRIRP